MFSFGEGEAAHSFFNIPKVVTALTTPDQNSGDIEILLLTVVTQSSRIPPLACP